MLYLKSMSIERFKSFKHISVLFNKGFNCIVGPNGSGKSNIVDALFFSLGESSLRRLRVDRLQYLIRESSTRKTQSMATAHVKLELDGDEKIEVIRGIRADGKTVYRLNGKRMTRQEVLEVLKKHRVHIDETSTIAQGEINKIIEANAKQRREFIDIAAGIQEFESKKKEAMSELDRVGIKISTSQAMLNERLTFLNELAKEKEAAEKYLAMTKKLRSLNYSILTKRQKTAQLALEGYSSDVSKLEAEKKGVEAKLAEYVSKISALSEERERITATLNNSTSTLDGVNKKLTEISNELSGLEVKINTGNVALQETINLTASITGEIKAAEEKIRENEAQMSELKAKLSELEAQAKRSSISSGLGDSGKRVKELDSSVAELEQEVAPVKDKLAKLQTEITLVDARKESTAKEISKLDDEIYKDMELAAGLKEKVEVEASKKEQADKKANAMQSRAAELRSALGSVDSEIISLKEHRAYAHSSDGALQSKLKAAFAKHPGFYGTVGELCSYDGKYAEAVEAAAGSRFNYLVVDSMDIANEMIQYLKKQNLGRATFIPLQELSVEQERKEEGLQALADLLEYDSRFGKAFTYIFSNTYLVKDVEEAKSLGTGRHRYVTMSGETVERAGVLSGGSRAKVLPIATLEKKIKGLEDTKARLFAEAKDVDATYFTNRRESVGAELEIASANSAFDECNKRIKGHGEQKSKQSSILEDIEKDAKRISAEIEGLEKEHARISKELATMKQERSTAYEESLEAAKKGMGKEEIEQIAKLSKEVEGLKIKSAELQQENKMLAADAQQKRKELGERKELAERTRESVSEYTKRRAGLSEAKEQAETHAKKSSKSNKEAFARQDVIARELEKLAGEQATVNVKADGFEKQINEIRVKQGQTETRLNDIAAELGAYENAEVEVLKEDVEKMEKEATSVSAKIEMLGSVNLKAPEAYDEKARSVNEATEKVNTLEGEKRAVLSMIEEIDSKKLNAFITTYSEVSKNFSKLYNYIYPGKARIELEDANDPLNTGLNVKIDDPNFVGQNRGLSGGQKSLLSLMLLFAIHMCKPSSVYLFDEIDSQLDKENAKKLSQLIKEMAKEAQFIVVSHSDSLIVNADAALGVTKSGGDSQVYGIEISNMRKQ